MAVLAASLGAEVVVSGPVATVPWNGRPGAASFTFDDDCQSQLDNLIPALRSRNVHATFFLYDVGGAFSNNKAAWIAAAKEGHELANHSVDHADFSKSIDATFQVSDMASRLRKADTAVQAVTFAYPYCAIGYESAVGADNIIGRGCLFAAPFRPLPWSSPPADWNNVGAIYVSDDATAAGPVLDALDAAKSGGWISTLNHGVGGDWVAVTTANVLAMFDRAIANGLWVGTYQEVAAYWRAGLAMDQASAVPTNSGWTVSWKSPHPRMPRSVPLRIRLDGGTFGTGVSVYQNGRLVAPQNDGSHVIEFMDLQMEVRKTVVANRDSILNGRFEEGTLGWSLNVWGGGAQGSVADGQYRIRIDSLGTHNSDIQLVQNGILLERGKSYEVRFDAYAEGPRSLEANVEMDDSPWTSYLPQLRSFALSTTKSTYTFVFPMTSPTDSNGRLSINAGSSTESVYLDDVSIRSVPSTAARGSRLPSGTRIRWSEGAFVLSGKESGLLQIVDTRGHSRIVGLNAGVADAGQLPDGLYLVRLRHDGKSGFQAVLVRSGGHGAQRSNKRQQPGAGE